MDNYFDQFDDQMRLDEYWLRWETIIRQRKEALENNDLLPIQPMGITLNLCYKRIDNPIYSSTLNLRSELKAKASRNH